MAVNITYREAKQRAKKERDIWVRRFVCDPITTPMAYLLARYSNTHPMYLTLVTFGFGMVAAIHFALGNLASGATAYALCFLTDSLDGKLNRVLGRDDTHRGIIDFILDGIVCVAVVIGLSLNGDELLLTLLLAWMSVHYLNMRYTSATYRLKVQFEDKSIWMVKGGNNWILRTYERFLDKTGTYPHPTVGEAVILMFVVGPLTSSMTWMVGIGILCIIPETIGAGLIAYTLAEKGAK